MALPSGKSQKILVNHQPSEASPMSRDGNTVSREYHGELTLNPEKSEQNSLVSRAQNREHPEILKNPQYI